MNRKHFLKHSSLIGTLGMFAPSTLLANENKSVNHHSKPQDDRGYWVDLLMKISEPVMYNICKGQLKKNMPLEVGPQYDLKVEKVTYLEAFGRTISGIAPWLALPDDDTTEGKQRKKLRDYTLQGLVNSVDPSSPDYLNFREEAQPLVDAAYLCMAFLRAPQTLWEPLDNKTKANIIKELKMLRTIKPAYSNWLLFAAMVEAFLLSINEDWEPFRTQIATKKIQEWYTGDGWYTDGPHFSFDYYNGYVMHPMMVHLQQVLFEKGKGSKEDLEQALKRMQRFAELQERMIAPDGTYPAIGRSMTYRTAAFQPLAQLALHHQLPESISPAQVRCALTAVKKNIYEMGGTFDDKGWLQLGICGHQPEVADVYTSTGSLYICTNSFLPLGLPKDDTFWSAPATEWTAQKVWAGKKVLKDYHVNY